MNPPVDKPRLYEFGPFRLDVAERVLWGAGRAVQLTPKVFDTLLILIERRGRLVRKDELMEALWPDSFVEERNLAQNIFLLRKALGDGERGRRYIQTVPKSGYRFIAEVRALQAPPGAEALDAARNADSPAQPFAVPPYAAAGAGGGSAPQETSRPPDLTTPGPRPRMKKTVALLCGLSLVAAGGTTALLLKRSADSAGGPQAAAERDRPASPAAMKPEANRYFQTGLHLWNQRTPDGIKKSVEYFLRTIEQEPGNALAYASLADSYFLIHFYGLDGAADGEAFRKSVAAAKASLELDPSLAEAHRAMAMIMPRDGPDSAAAETYFRKSIELNPSLATTRQRYGQFLMRNGRLDEGLAELRRAHELAPTSPSINRAFAQALFFSRRYDEVIRLCRVWLDVDATDASARSDLITSYTQKGMRPEAETELRRLEGDAMGRMEALRVAGYMNAVFGNHPEARRLADRFAAEARGWPAYSAHYLAAIYAALGGKEEALRHLRRAGELTAAGPEYQKEFYLDSLLFAPQFDRLRGDSRFEELLRRHGLTR